VIWSASALTPATYFQKSDRDQVDEEISGDRQPRKVRPVRGDDHVSVVSQKNDRGIHHIVGTGRRQHLAGPPSELVVEGANVEPPQKPGQVGLSTRPAAPNLAHNPAVGDGPPLAGAFLLDEGHGERCTTLDCY